MQRFNRQTFVAPGMLATGREKKLHELYATRSHNTSSVMRVDNSKTHFMSSTINDKSIDNSFMRHSSNKAHYSDGDPFNPMTNVPQGFTLIGSSHHG